MKHSLHNQSHVSAVASAKLEAHQISGEQLAEFLEKLNEVLDA